MQLFNLRQSDENTKNVMLKVDSFIIAKNAMLMNDKNNILREKCPQRNGSSMRHICGKLLDTAGHAIFTIFLEQRFRSQCFGNKTMTLRNLKMYPPTISHRFHLMNILLSSTLHV